MHTTRFSQDVTKLAKRMWKERIVVETPANDGFEYKFQLLKQEIDTIENGIRTYDANLFVIKGWAITVFSAFILAAVQAKQPIFLVFCAFAVLLFWFVDAIHKTIQRIYTRRSREIETFLQSREFDLAIAERSFREFPIPDTASNFRMKYREQSRILLHVALLPQTSILYLSMVVLAIAMLVTWQS